MLSRRWSHCIFISACAGLAALAGCGINKSRLATEQVVISDAVDRAVAAIDFSPLSGRKVYFDTQYLDGVNMGPNGNIKYVVSSLRQQMLAYDCRLQEKPETADYVVEGRIGALANDGYEVTYGIPGNAAMASASVFFSSPLSVPTMPELSLGRRNHQAGTAKVGLFAYDRATREPVWQAGVTKATSEARDAWVLGLGPYQRQRKSVRSWWRRQAAESAADPLAAYQSRVVFERATRRPPASDQPSFDKALAEKALAEKARADTAPDGKPPEIAAAGHTEPVKALEPPAPILLPPAGRIIPLTPPK